MSPRASTLKLFTAVLNIDMQQANRADRQTPSLILASKAQIKFVPTAIPTKNRLGSKGLE